MVPLVGYIFDFIMSEKTAELCPEVRSELRIDLLGIDHSIRSPYLAHYNFVGIIIGFVGGFNVIRLQRQQRKRMQKQLREERSVLPPKSADTLSRDATPWCWPVAFIMFGIMNASAFFLHCWEENGGGASTAVNSDGSISISSGDHGTNSYPVTSPHWWSIDAYSTGVFFTSILLGVMNQMHPKSGNSWLGIYGGLQLVGLSGVVIFYAELYGIISISAKDHNHSAASQSLPLSLSSSIILEQWYGLSTIAFGHFWFEFLIFHNQRVQFPILTMFLTISAYIMTALGILQDGSLCQFAKLDGGKWDDMLCTTAVIFLTCDMVLAAVYLWLNQLYSLDQVRLRSSTKKQR